MILSTENGSASIRYRIRRVGSNILRHTKMLFNSAFCLNIILTKGANCQHLRTSKYRYPLNKFLKTVLLHTKNSIPIKHSL